MSCYQENSYLRQALDAALTENLVLQHQLEQLQDDYECAEECWSNIRKIVRIMGASLHRIANADRAGPYKIMAHRTLERVERALETDFKDEP